ncbi:SMI1/KNR4 family protein [Flavobacterium branchiicola]|uniref:SMI1/KNR4 family protein n=1 Tax=Flavobacterium branchiicola TaxID=1114875 RepID=A0ABV9PAD2_9FLAO|nr:SMI1/KNR4 family protein [Flavobacterium branchiicola]MBS7253207.1 SMI1/KNR4 family protein [Flavobacterium branchiicola]
MNQETLNQIERIKIKLFLAKETDKDFEVFGADSHEYNLGKTVTEQDILKFENDYKVVLPDSYKAFLQHIGNGGNSYQNAAAGPSYGIFPLGKNIEEFISNNPEKYLNQDCVLHPDMSDEFWEGLTKKIDEDDAISDEDYYEELGEIFSGILPISSQGCTYYNGLVLNGEFKGRIINVDIDRQKPFFTFDSNFLDWYERWLDEITAETSVGYDDLFDYTLGGASKHILEVFGSTDDKEIKLECLSAILRKKEVNLQNLDFLEKEYQSENGDIQKKLLQILTKFDYNRAYSHLIDFVEKDLLTVFQFVFWYAKEKSSDWLEVIKENVSKVNDEETFRFCTYLLKETGIDYGSTLIPFASHSDKAIRVDAYYTLGQLKNKTEYLETFILGLNDKENRVVHITLQALDGVKDRRLLRHYKNIAERFPLEQDYILINLDHRLKEFDLSTETIKRMNFDQSEDEVEKKWFQFWK